MSKLLDEMGTQERIVYNRWTELRDARLAMSVPAPALAPNSEEDLFEKFFIELKNKRDNQTAAQEARDNEVRRTKSFAWVPSVIPVVGLIIAVVLPSMIGGDDFTLKFRWMAFSAAVVGGVAAFCRLWAHGGSTRLDGIGKALGLTSALLAASATLVLLLVQ